MSKLAGYEYYKEKYNNTKPIRGRSVECKPLGSRHRDWETVEKNDLGNGDFSYSARLYQTQCVTYYPNGDIRLIAETWSTPITASFIGNHSPFRCYKAYKKLWVSLKSSPDEVKAYPINEGNEGLMIEWVEGDWYKPVGEVKVHKQVVDREKAKKAREPLEPFLKWAKMIHKLSDGWIMDETRKQYGKEIEDPWRSHYSYDIPAEVANKEYNGGLIWATTTAYEWFSKLKEEDYMLAYMALTAESWKAEDKKVSRVVTTDAQTNRTTHYHDLKFGWDFIKRQVWRIAEDANDIHKTIEVEIGNTAIHGVV